MYKTKAPAHGQTIEVVAQANLTEIREDVTGESVYMSMANEAARTEFMQCWSGDADYDQIKELFSETMDPEAIVESYRRTGNLDELAKEFMHAYGNKFLEGVVGPDAIVRYLLQNEDLGQDILGGLTANAKLVQGMALTTRLRLIERLSVTPDD